MTSGRHITKHRLARIELADADSGNQGVSALMISAAGEMGGAERSLHEVLCALPPERLQACVCAPPDTELLRLCVLSNIAAFPVPMRRFRRTTNPFLMAGQLRAMHQASRSISAFCAERRFEVLHANTDTAALLAWEVSRALRIPFIWHCRDMRPMHGFARVLSAAAAAVVPISGAVERHLLREGVAADKLNRIDNGIDLSRLPGLDGRQAARERGRDSLGIPANVPVLLAIGAFVPWKKHELFLEALAALRKRQPLAVGLLAGSDLSGQNDGYAEFLRERARALSLDANAVRFLGQREDVPDLMAAADVLVSCSENEPFGRVVAEAGAAGLPAVTTDSGGKGEILEHGATGLLVESGSAAKLADACVRLLSDSGLRAEMGRNARERVARLYDVRRTARELAELIERIAGRRPAAAAGQ